MEKDDLKLLWKEIHSEDSFNNEGEIKKFINMKHSKRITEVLSLRKKEMLIYCSVLFLLIALMFYALVILKISFSFFSLFLFSFVGMFLFFKTTHSISTFVVLSKETKNISIIDASKSFSKMLKRIYLIDFFANILFFYTLIAMLIVTLYDEIEAMNNLNLLVPVISIIFILFLIPWLIKWLHSKRYKRFYSELKNIEELL